MEETSINVAAQNSNRQNQSPRKALPVIPGDVLGHGAGKEKPRRGGAYGWMWWLS